MGETHRFAMLYVERVDEGSNYLIHGLPEDTDADFRKKSSYETLEANALSICGIGFSTSGCELSQYQHTVVVEQGIPGGYAHITFDDRES